MTTQSNVSHKDSGDLVQTIIIVAIFAVIAIAGTGLMGSIIREEGQQAASNLSDTMPVTDHAELCANEAVKESGKKFEPVITILQDEPLDDGSHKITVKADSSFEEFGDYKVFECAIDANGKIASMNPVEKTEEVFPK